MLTPLIVAENSPWRLAKHGADAEEADVLAVRRGDMSQDLIWHVPARGAQLPHGQLVVLGRLGDHGGDQHGGPAPRRGLGRTHGRHGKGIVGGPGTGKTSAAIRLLLRVSAAYTLALVACLPTCSALRPSKRGWVGYAAWHPSEPTIKMISTGINGVCGVRHLSLLRLTASVTCLLLPASHERMEVSHEGIATRRAHVQTS